MQGMNEIYRTDEEIIKRFAFLTVCYGNTLAFCNELDNMKIQFDDPGKQVIWKHIFEGVKYQIFKKYDFSLTEFDKADKLIDKNSTLDLFYQRQRLFSYVFSKGLDIKEVRKQYKKLRSQFSSKTDRLTKSLIAGTLINECYLVWKRRDRFGTLDLCDEIIKKYEDSENDQLSAAIAMNNKASVLANLGKDAEAIHLLDAIEEKYGNHNEPGITKQVMRAISRKAMFSYNNDDLEEAHKLYKKITDTYSKKDDATAFEDSLINASIMQADILGEMEKKDDALNLYTATYEFHKDSNNLNVQENVLSVVLRKMELLKATGKFDEQIETANNAIKQFMGNDTPFIQLKLLEVMFKQAKTFHRQSKWNDEILAYNNIIESYKSANSPPFIKEQILRAMQDRIVSLKNIGFIDQVIQAYDEAIEFCAGSKDFAAPVPITLLAEKAELQMDSGDYDGYKNTYNEIYAKTNNSEKSEIREIIARLMLNRAIYEGKRHNLPEKAQLYREIIHLFGNDTGIVVMMKIVTTAIYRLGCISAREEKCDEAIKILYGARKYASCTDDDIRFNVARALYDRIDYLAITGNKKGEIKAYEEFIELFKSSTKKGIKKMLITAELELQGKRRRMKIWNKFGAVGYRLKSFWNKNIKEPFHDLLQWFIVGEVISLIVLFISSVSINIKEGTNISHPMEIVYKMSSNGEIYFLCIPLLAGMLVEFYQKKERSGFNALVFWWFLILLFVYFFFYITLLLTETKQINLLFLTTLLPLIILNVSATLVKLLSNAIVTKKGEKDDKFHHSI